MSVGRRLPSLNALRAFESAARHMSFSQAAVELNVTQGAISRQIKSLEDYLGVPLFRRLPRSLELTDEGRQYVGPLHQAFEYMYRATEAFLEGRRIATLNVNVLPTFGMRWLIPRLTDFTAACPSIEVRMISSIRPVDFKLEDCDVAIRVGPSKRNHRTGERSPIDLVMTHDWQDVRAIPLVPDRLVVVCSPSLRDGKPPLRTPADLERHTLLHTTTREYAWTYWLSQNQLGGLTSRTRLVFGHFFMTIQAAIEGKGVAVVPRVLIESELSSGTLVTPFEGADLTAGMYYLLARESDWHSQKIQKFRAWILSEAEKGQSPLTPHGS
jgi:LysR family glycine cleavage system transcriptional activator